MTQAAQAGSEVQIGGHPLFTRERLLWALKVMVQARLVDEKMMKLVKQNKGGTFHLSAAGHEMIGAVSAAALRPGVDWACAYYRDQPLAIGLGADLVELFGVCMGRETKSQSKGRMMPYHFSSAALRMPTQSSVVGTQFLPAVGIAQGIKLSGSDEIVYTSGGDGSTSQGDFHEALNYAGLHKLPIVFVVHDNGYAISVPVEEQTAGGSVAAAFQNRPGVPLHAIDGCDFEEFTLAMDRAVARARSGEGPSLVVAKVPRINGHSNSDDPAKYRSEESCARDQTRDPLPRFERWLIEERGIAPEEIQSLKTKVAAEVESAAAEAMNIPFPDPSTAAEHLFAPYSPTQTCERAEGEKIVMVDAINKALAEEMDRNPKVVVFGEDVAHGKGGVFGATRNLTQRFGATRCFNTPLAESTIVGLSLGLSLQGHIPVAEIQFADYLWPAFDQLVSEVSSTCYRSGGEFSVPLVLRMPYGGYIQGGPYHSQCIEGILAHIPGLKVAIPSNAADAKGLLKAAIRDPNPTLFLEHKALYRQAKFSARPEVSSDYILPFGQAEIVREGKDLTLVAWGMTVVMAVDIAQKLPQIDIEIIDLRTITPLDTETILNSVKKTGKLLVAHEAPRNAGFGAEVAARLAEEAFEFLDAPITRVGSLDTPIPYSKPLETAVLVQHSDLKLSIQRLHAY